MRLSKISKELNIGIQTLVDFLNNTTGESECWGPMSNVSDDLYALLQSEFSKNGSVLSRTKINMRRHRLAEISDNKPVVKPSKNAIGFKNFRRFENFPTMELGDITMLVGGNNSGKSTVVKAILLVHHFLQTKVSEMSAMATLDHPVFTFDVPNVNIGTFAIAYNRKSAQLVNPNNTIEFVYQVGNFEFTVDITDRGNNTHCAVKRIKIKDLTGSLSYIFHFDCQRMELILDNKSESGRTNEDIINDINFIENVAIPDKKKEIEACSNLDEILQLKNELTNLESHLAEAKKIAFDQIQFDRIIIDLGFSTYAQQDNYLTALVREFLDFADRPMPSSISKKTSEYVNMLDDKQFILSNKTLIDSSIRNLSNVLATPIEFISAHMARQTIFFKASDKNDYMAQAIHEFAKLRINPWDEEFLFVDQWLQRFEIADEFRILNHGGEAYEIRMLEDTSIYKIKGFSSPSEIPLVGRALSNIPSKSLKNVDKFRLEQSLWEQGEPLGAKGMGAIQITILLLQLATYMKRYKNSPVNPIIMIEEPEQNLHPRLQSLLADLFLAVSKQYGFSFLIETHSEYMIRKTQVLWAEMVRDNESQALNNPFSVFYFPKTGLPYNMGYLNNGRFEKKFGPGFFDVASEYSIQLNKLGRINN